MIHFYNQIEPEREILSVSDLNRLSRGLLEDAFPMIWVEGEISNLSRPSSGHLYFSLKDAHAQIRCAFFRGRQNGLPFSLEDGQYVLVRAKVSLYEGRGDYQLIVETAELAGDGALLKAFEALKHKLAAQGLFDPARKKAVPTFPKCVGVITSPSGAAIKDVLSVLKRRFPLLPVFIYPSVVQGNEAARQLISALNDANQHGTCDVLLLVRGGGSLEDLWCFNDENLAHAIVNSKIPVITGIGHEIDFTIADFAADYRAPTPSAAAEFISPNQRDLQNLIATLFLRLVHLQKQKIQQLNHTLYHLIKSLPHPRTQLQQLLQRCDYLELQLRQCMVSWLHSEKNRLVQLVLKLKHFNPHIKIIQHQKNLYDQQRQLKQHILLLLKQKHLNLKFLAEKLDLASPLKTLARGYSIVEDATSGKLISSKFQVTKGQLLNVRVSDGEFKADVK